MKQHAYQSTPLEAIIRFDDQQDAIRAIKMTAAAMRSHLHDKPYYRLSMAHAVRSRIAFYAGADGQRELSKHDVI